MTTPWDDNEERVTFSEREWEIMLSDPAFGYVCQNGHSQHRWNQYPQWDGTCFDCEAEAEAAYYAEEEEYPAWMERDPVTGLVPEPLTPDVQSATLTPMTHLTYGDLPTSPPTSLGISCVSDSCWDRLVQYSATRGDYFWSADSDVVACGVCGEPMELTQRVESITVVPR